MLAYFSSITFVAAKPSGDGAKHISGWIWRSAEEVWRSRGMSMSSAGDMLMLTADEVEVRPGF